MADRKSRGTRMVDGSARARVLVVDDEQGMRDMLSFELSNEGFEVVCAESGARAVEISKSLKFDIVITDLKMPGMDGVVTMSALKTIDPSLEIIVATGYATVDTAIACMKQGAYDYIQKPFDLAELRMVIDRALEQRRLKGIVSLYQAGQVLISTLKQGELIQLGLEMAGRLHNASAAGLVLQSKDSGRLEIHKLEGSRQPSDALLEKMGLASMAEGVAIRRTAGEQELSECTKEGFHSCLAFPLVAREELRGTLVLLRESGKQPFSASEQQTGSVFATQLAMSLENARLVGELEDKLEELIATRDKLIQVEKMALAGRLAGAVAHEVNNPLGYIRANLSALKEYTRDFGRCWAAAKRVAAGMQQSEDPKLEELAGQFLDAGGIGQKVVDEQLQDVSAILDECREGISRIASLVADFAQLAKPREPGEAQRVDLAELIQKGFGSQNGSHGAGSRKIQIELEQSYPTRVARVDLESAISHLITFLQRYNKNGTPVVEPILVRVAKATGRPLVELKDPALFLTDEERSGIFNPRIEEDKCSGGTMRLNIGLAIAHQLLRANGAELGVTSDRATGTTISILLSRTE